MSLDRESLQRHYDERYGSFGSHPGFAEEAAYARGLIRLLARRRRLRPLGRVSYLDIGCGLGFKTRALAEGFERALGIDLSPKGIAIAQALNDLPTLEFRLADVDAVDERFELVTAFGVSIFNVADVAVYAGALRSYADRLLVPGGSLVVVGQTDFSGRERGGWRNHRPRQLAEVARLAGADLSFPHRDPLGYTTAGADAALRRLGRLAVRRLRDYCLVVPASASP